VSADPERARLDAELLAWMREPDASPSDDERFDDLALRLFAFQFARCEPFRRLCLGRGRTPDSVARWQEIPAVPTGAFKEMALRSFPSSGDSHVFRTSGTATASRGSLHLDTLELYEASLLPTFSRFVLPDLANGERMRHLFLAPSPEAASDSSLSHMFGVIARERSSADSVFEMDVKRGRRLLDNTDSAVCLCGTAFAFVHLLESLEADGARLQLRAGTRVMETGGFKGRTRQVPRRELHARITASLGVPAERIVNQYGMTELGSQFYDSVLSEPGSPRRKLGPPWARARVIDPASGDEAREAGHGVIQIVDLANTGSVLAVATADLGVRIGDGFDVLGREPGAEERGCSIAADEMLAG
jgi:hypothetical protein